MEKGGDSSKTGSYMFCLPAPSAGGAAAASAGGAPNGAF